MNQLWRFVVDGRLQKEEEGWRDYDQREPGSVAAVICGMAEALNHINDESIAVGLKSEASSAPRLEAFKADEYVQNYINRLKRIINPPSRTIANKRNGKHM